MPIYQYQCNQDHISQRILSMSGPIPDFIHCGDCGRIALFIWPLVAMQPDNMWSGTDTRFGHFTSKSQYNQLLKERSIESISKKELDTVKKNVYTAKQDRKNKINKNRNEFLNQELANVEISPDGNTIKERNKYVRKRQ